MRSDSVFDILAAHLLYQNIAPLNQVELLKTGGLCRTGLPIRFATRSREFIYIESHGVSHIHHCSNQFTRGAHFQLMVALRIVHHWIPLSAAILKPFWID